MLLPRRVLSWLLALALLLGQATAFAHALGHLDPRDAALPDHPCELCLAQAGLGGTLPVQVFHLPVIPPAGLTLPPATVVAAPQSLRCAHARAPPAAV